MKLTRRAFYVFAASLLTTTLAASFGCSDTKTETTASTTGGTSSSPSAGVIPKQMVMGFTPAAEAQKVAEDAKPLAAFLSKEIGIPITTFTSTDYSGLVEAMGSGKVDIGALPPLAYVLASDQKAASVMVKVVREDKITKKPTLTYKAMFVARADSGIKKIEDAKGKRMAFVDPSSTSGYLFPAAFLKKKGYDPETFFSQLIYAGSHDKAVQSVYNGDVDIAACYDDARNLLEKNGIKDVKQKVSIVEYTGDIPNDTISARQGLDPALVQKMKDALIKFAKTDEGKKVLFTLYEAKDLVEAKDSDYDPVREVAKSMDVQLSMFSKEKKAPTGASTSPAAPASPAAKKP